MSHGITQVFTGLLFYMLIYALLHSDVWRGNVTQNWEPI